MSYDPKAKKHKQKPHHKHRANPNAKKALKLAHSAGISVKTAWQRVRSMDRQRKITSYPHHKSITSGKRGGIYFSRPSGKKGYHPLTKHRRSKSHRRRHDPQILDSRSRGILGKLTRGAVKVLGGNVGGIGGSIINGVLPYTVSAGGKAWNIPTEAAALTIGTLDESTHGLLQDFLDGVTGGMAAVGDPAPHQGSSLGGNHYANMRNSPLPANGMVL